MVRFKRLPEKEIILQLSWPPYQLYTIINMQAKKQKKTNKMNRKKERYRFHMDLSNKHLTRLLNICIDELDFKSFGRIFQRTLP